MVKRRKAKKGDRKKSYIEDGRANKIGGILILGVSLGLLFSFLSYFFTWSHDFNKVRLPFFELIRSPEYSVDNILGKLGSYAAHLFMYRGIGIAIFIPLYMVFKTGIVTLLGGSTKSLLREWKWTTYLSIFLSCFFAFAFSSLNFNLGGNIGIGIRDFFIQLIGSVGLAVLFILLLIFVVIWLFNPDFNAMTHPDQKVNFRQYLSLFSIKKSLKNNRASKTERKKNIVDKKNHSDGEAVTDIHPTSNSKQKPPEVHSDDADTPSNGNDHDKLDSSDELEIITPQNLKEEDRFKLKTDEFVNLDQSSEKLIVEKENIEHLEPYDPTKDLRNYKYPSIEILKEYGTGNIEFDRQELNEKKDQIVETLSHYKIEINSIKATVGPTVTLYEIIPAPGVKISKIKNLEDDIALSLAALGIRIIAPIPGRGTIGIEVPNKKRQIVGLRELLESRKFQEAKMDLPIALGKTISAEVFIADLAKMPHLLVAGATGQGKSVGINTILASILFKKHPSQVKLILVDPKKVELSIYGEIENHFLAYLPDEEEPIITETKKVINTLNSLCIEMDDRYNLLKKGRTRNIKEYNEKFTRRRLNPEKGHRFLPFIILVIDEFADLIMTAGKEIELPIGRLAQLARAVGIHLIIATQRPSVNIITGIIKANFPARLAFKVTSKVDSRTILDAGGADQLVGQGDMLLSVGGKMIRLQCAFIDTPEVEELVDGIAEQASFPKPYFLPEYKSDEDDEKSAAEITLNDLDEFFDEAARMVVNSNSGSTSMLQRKMKLGYNRAGRIMDQLEHFGIVGPTRGSKPREVMITDEMELNQHLKAIRNMN